MKLETAFEELEEAAQELNEVREDLRRRLLLSFSDFSEFIDFCYFGKVAISRAQIRSSIRRSTSSQ